MSQTIERQAQPTEGEWVRVASLADLQAEGRLTVLAKHNVVALFESNGQVYAVDNRCPHLGFPLDKGTVNDCILTCHWHHARFDLASGCTMGWSAISAWSSPRACSPSCTTATRKRPERPLPLAWTMGRATARRAGVPVK